jgi:signal transduction histidine kinase
MGLDVSEEYALGIRTRRAERLASLGTMAAGLAHEIKNPLNAAHLQLTLAQRRLGRAGGADVEGARAAAELVGGEMHRLAALVEEFLQFARPQALRLARGDLKAAAESVVQLLEPETSGAGIEVKLDGNAVQADFDHERVKQVVLNLVRNAVEATGRGGHVGVHVGRKDGMALLQVEDDGPGIQPPDAPIFEPFFTTKENGTGLGLAIIHRIVSDHGGEIGVESAPGRTIFSITLPV